MRPLACLLSAAAAVAVGVVPTVSATAAAGRAAMNPGSAGVWRSVALPRTVAEPAELYSVTVVSRWSAWAAGQEAMGANSRGLILHWNGLRWTKERVPAGPVIYLTAISAASPADAWAVGYDDVGGSHILHRQRGAWREVPLPPDLRGWDVDAIAAARSGTAWVWGYNGSRFGYVLEHWNGTAWRRITVPYADLGNMSVLKPAGLAGIWAAGDTTSGGTEVLHWDGRSWSQIEGPPNNFGLNDVLVTQPRDLWAAGDYCLSAQSMVGCTNGGLQIARWNGMRWNTDFRQHSFYDAMTISADQSGQPQWAGLDAPDPARILYEHFDGRHWSVVLGAPLRGATDVTSYTAHIPGTDATWAVGFVTTKSTVTPFIQVNAG